MNQNQTDQVEIVPTHEISKITPQTYVKWLLVGTSTVVFIGLIALWLLRQRSHDASIPNMLQTPTTTISKSVETADWSMTHTF